MSQAGASDFATLRAINENIGWRARFALPTLGAKLNYLEPR